MTNIIYSNFEELVDKNKSIFEYLGKTGQQGLLRAIWDSRQQEIEQLKHKLHEQENLSTQLKSQTKEYKASNENYMEEIHRLKKYLNESKEYGSQTKDYSLNLKNDLGKLRQELISTQSKLSHYSEDNERLKTIIKHQTLNADQLTQEISGLQVRLLALKETNVTLDKIKAELNIKESELKLLSNQKNEQKIKLSKDLENSEKKLAEFRSLLTEKDYASGQRLNILNKEVVKLSMKLKKLNKEHEDYQRDKAQLLADLKILKSDKENINSLYLRASEIHKTLQNQVRQQRQEIEKLKDSMQVRGKIYSEKIEKREQIINSFKRQNLKLKKSIENYLSQVEAQKDYLQDQMNSMRTTMESIQGSLGELSPQSTTHNQQMI